MVDNTSAAALRSILDGRWSAVRDEVRDSLNSADWATPTEPVPIADYRERTTSQLLQLLREPWTRAGFSAQPGQPGDIGASLTAFECLGHVDLSLFVKVGVQVGLFGGAIAGLGTERHHREYLDRIAAGDLLGCFAMTEVGGGSDVANLGTTATTTRAVTRSSCTARPERDQGLHRQCRQDGTLAAVFAQLVVDGTSHGVHCVSSRSATRPDSPSPV